MEEVLKKNKIDVYGTDWCSDTQRAKLLLDKNKVDYNFINIDTDKDAAILVEEINKGKRIIPTFIIDGKSYTNPNNPILESALNIEIE